MSTTNNTRDALVADLIDTLNQLRAIVGTPAQDADALIDAVRSLADDRAARQGVEPEPFRLLNWYRTQGGDLVQFVKAHNIGTNYATMEDQHGVNRYVRRDFGRVTGSAHDYSDPRNTPPLYAAQPEPIAAEPAHEAIARVQMQFAGIVRAAVSLIAEVDENHATKGVPGRYTVPWGAVVALKDALTTTPAPEVPADRAALADWVKLRATEYGDARVMASRDRATDEDVRRATTALGDVIDRLAAAPAPAATGVHEPARIGHRVCNAVAELPDRNSPDDWPEAMLVTADELLTIVINAIRETPPLTPAPSKASEPVAWRPADLVELADKLMATTDVPRAARAIICLSASMLYHVSGHTAAPEAPAQLHVCPRHDNDIIPDPAKGCEKCNAEAPGTQGGEALTDEMLHTGWRAVAGKLDHAELRHLHSVWQRLAPPRLRPVAPEAPAQPGQGEPAVLENAAEVRHPMQPQVIDEHGVIRFRKNLLVNHLYDWASARGMGMNEMAGEGFAPEEWRQFAQLIGYSVSGWGDLSCVDDEAWNLAHVGVELEGGE